MTLKSKATRFFGSSHTPANESTQSIALVVDPEFGPHLKTLAARMHTWIVSSPDNDRAAKEIWRQSMSDQCSGVTIFLVDPALSMDRRRWCDVLLDSLDEHHNSHANPPGYTILEVYGIDVVEELPLAFIECGFERFEPTEFGFRAFKEPIA